MQTRASSHSIQPESGEPLLATVVAAQMSHAFFPPPASGHDTRLQPVVVAVSGGLDSVVLLHLLVQLAPAWRLTLHVAHVDHDLRPASAGDAAFVRTLAGTVGLPFHTVRLDGASLRADRSGLEAAARAERYRFLCATANNVTPSPLVPIIAVAHHADDQAETLLLRLVQGSGPAGLAGMRPVTLLDSAGDRSVRLVRPLLSIPRTAILDYARRHDVTWREDESNTDSARARNLLRNTVLPELARLNPDVAATLARTATLLTDESDRLLAADEESCRRLCVLANDECIVLQLAGLRALTQSVRRGVLRVALAGLGRDLRAIDYAQLDALAAAVDTAVGHTGPHPLPHGLAWSIVTDFASGTRCLSLHRGDALPVPPPGPWLPADWRATAGVIELGDNSTVRVAEWMLTCNTVARNEIPSGWQDNADRWTVYLDREQVGTPVLDVARPGMKLAPLGMGGRHRSVGDIFTDSKIPPPLRLGWPIVYDRTSGAVIWVCGLAQSHPARVTATTRLVWVVRWARGTDR